MNELHEQYETLLRRGMPTHPTLKYTRFYEPCVRCAMDGDVAILPDADARDLLTMHALRWVNSSEVGRALGGGVYSLGQQRTLEDIIRFTAPLEPKP